jgi:flagellum-specific peptidoglycan hydrolase FlgJ
MTNAYYNYKEASMFEICEETDELTKFEEAKKAAKTIWRDHQIPVGFSMSIATLESGHFSSEKCLKDNNCFGIRNASDEYRKYTSITACFLDFAKIMKTERYQDLFYSSAPMDSLFKEVAERGYCDPSVKSDYVKILLQLARQQKRKWS